MADEHETESKAWAIEAAAAEAASRAADLGFKSVILLAQ